MHFIYEVENELSDLEKLLEKMNGEAENLESVFALIRDHNNYLKHQLETYKAYLQNVRVATAAAVKKQTNVGGGVGGGGSSGAIATVSGGVRGGVSPGISPSSSSTSSLGLGVVPLLGPFKYTHAQLEKEGVIVESDIPENRRASVFFNMMSPQPGSFIIGLHYKGRDKSILELDVKLDDLLEKQHANDQTLDLEYVQFSVDKTMALLNKAFLRR